MIKTQQVRLLAGVRGWNAWRKKQGNRRIDLAGARLRGQNIAKANLSHARLSRANLQKVDATRADFGGADLRSADLSESQLSGAVLADADLGGADLSSSDLLGADLHGANLKGVNLRSAQLAAVAGLTQRQVEQAVGDAHTGLPRSVQHPRSWLPPVVAATRPDPRHYDVLREGAKVWNQWRKLDPDAAIDLRGANLRSDTLEGANLQRADLSGANIGHANAGGADFTRAKLANADLTRSDLTGATFTGARLKGTRLDNARLAEATGLTQKQIDQAIGNDRTGLPEGLRRPVGWPAEARKEEPPPRSS